MQQKTNTYLTTKRNSEVILQEFYFTQDWLFFNSLPTPGFWGQYVTLFICVAIHFTFKTCRVKSIFLVTKPATLIHKTWAIGDQFFAIGSRSAIAIWSKDRGAIGDRKSNDQDCENAIFWELRQYKNGFVSKTSMLVLKLPLFSPCRVGEGKRAAIWKQTRSSQKRVRSYIVLALAIVAFCSRYEVYSTLL